MTPGRDFLSHSQFVEHPTSCILIRLMKRLSEIGPLSASRRLKRRRESASTTADAAAEDPSPFGGSLPLRTATEVCGSSEGAKVEGCLKVKVVMRWNHANRILIHGETREGNTPVRFEMVLRGFCRDYFVQHEIAFDIGEMFYVSLQGAHVETKSMSKPANSKLTILPMTICYQEGILLHFVESRTAAKTVAPIDTWTGVSK